MKITSWQTNSLGIVTALFVFTSIFFATLPAEAKTKTVTPEKDLATLMEELNHLQTLLTQRDQFNLAGPVTSTERPEYFTLNLAENSTKLITAKKNGGTISINTDGGVSQLLLVTKCEELKGVITLGQNKDCVEQTWFTNYTEKDGIRNFIIPIIYTSNNTKDLGVQFDFTVYACRYNGCVYETDFSVQYKDALDFADTLKIYDRYEWTYEWEDNIYHVQEVLLSFPYSDIRKIKLHVRCDAKGLYLSTTEDKRASCYEKRVYTQPDFREYTTDDQGNVFNLRIESVTKDIQKENVEAVAMTFTFIGKNNAIAHEVTYRPIQLDVEEEEDENDDEDRE